MDHEKDPHLLLVVLIVMLITGLSTKIDYCSYVYRGMIWTIWLGLAEWPYDVLASLNQLEVLKMNELETIFWPRKWLKIDPILSLFALLA